MQFETKLYDAAIALLPEYKSNPVTLNEIIRFRDSHCEREFELLCARIDIKLMTISEQECSKERIGLNQWSAVYGFTQGVGESHNEAVVAALLNYSDMPQFSRHIRKGFGWKKTSNEPEQLFLEGIPLVC